MKRERGVMLMVLGVVATVSIVTIFATQKRDVDRDLFMQNVEALSAGESVQIPCVKADGWCTFEVVNADGETGTMTIDRHRNV